MSSVPEQVRVVELELTAQALRDTLREKEKEMEGTAREMRKQQADRHRYIVLTFPPATYLGYNYV